MDSIEILRRLIAFPTVSHLSNLALIDFVVEILRDKGVACELVRDQGKQKANLFATVGPADRPGVLLSGHTDVVPVDGQNWAVPAFTLSEHAGRLYGRGTADMKGFIACALSAVLRAADMELQIPFQLALSYDEEIGCIGVRSLIETLERAPLRPILCIVGEPTGMEVATGHKGKTAARCTCIGREGHSALAPLAVNAIHMGADFVGELRAEQSRLSERGAHDQDYDVPYTTIHVGKMNAGIALNIVPNLCTLDFEIRNVAADDPEKILDRLRAAAGKIAKNARRIAPEATIEIDVINAYPGLDVPRTSNAVTFVRSLTGANNTIKVAFGTEGGLFNQRLAIPAVICGPGYMAQGHKPDEFVSVEQMHRCDLMLDALLDRLSKGSGLTGL